MPGLLASCGLRVRSSRSRRGWPVQSSRWATSLVFGGLLVAGGVVSAGVLARTPVGGTTGVALLSLDRAVAPATLLSSEMISLPAAFEPEESFQAVQVDHFTQLPGVRPEAAAVQQQVSAEPTFDGRSLRPVRRMAMKVTAYSPDERSCGQWADGTTASGYSVWTNGMSLVAADTRMLPFGTLVSIPGYNGGRPVQVLDRGGAIKGNRLDVLYPSHEIALQWGVQDLEVTVWEYAD